MKIVHLTFLTSLIFSSILGVRAQDYCSQSWKSGSSKIKEEELYITLGKDVPAPTFREYILDSSGKARYELDITIGTAGPEKEIIEWAVGLYDTAKNDSQDLLKPTNDKLQDRFSSDDRPGWFYLGANSANKGDKSVLPFLGKRVIRVEGFYCVMEVIKFNRNAKKPSVIDSAVFHIRFVNAKEPPSDQDHSNIFRCSPKGASAMKP